MFRLIRPLAVATLTIVAYGAQQPAAQPKKQQRDLKYEKDSVDAPLTSSVAIPRSYALVIGVGKYKNLRPDQQLQFTERDADAIYSILISPEGGNFRAENVKKLTGERATLAAMKRELEQWLPTASTPDDRVVIYFAGHGFVHQGKGYLAPYDFDAGDIPGTGYPMATLGSVIGGKIKAKWKVLLTDSCHAGAITPQDNEMLNTSLQQLNRSLFSLTASRARERSFESADWGGGHGIFTYYVVKGLEGSADENRDGMVTADELAEYTRVNVRQATEGKQNPTADRADFDPNMLLSFIPANAAPGTPPAPRSGGLIIEANRDGVEVFVDGKSAGVVNKDKPLRLPGLVPGVHVIKGVHLGYEPDGPREETVYPGQDITVSLKLVIPRRRNKAAVDAFDRGAEFYNKGSAENYKRAAEEFSKALSIDANYSQAALFLARAERDLFRDDEAERNFKRAIEIDPDYLEARATYGGMLLDKGATDESIRQLNAVVQRDPKHPTAWYMLAQALRIKELYPDSIDAARKAIALTPNNAEPYFWLAESLRMSAKYQDSIAAYKDYLRLSDFDSKLAGKMNYYVMGFLIGTGKKKRAAQRDVWKDLRSMAFLGLCDNSRLLNRFEQAIPYCQRALTYDSADAHVHYALGLSYFRQADASGSVELLPAARKHFRSMLDINPNLAEAEYARKNIATIDAFLAAR